MSPRDLGIYPEVQTRPDVALDEEGKLLLRAIDILRERGWCQRDYGLDGGPVCATGALLAAGAYSVGRINRRLGFSGVGEDWLTFWNDGDGRTADEVIARLRSAAHAVPE